MTLNPTQVEAIRAAYQNNPGAVLEEIAKEQGVTTRDVLSLLPESEAVSVDGSHFEQVMREMATWGDLTFLINTGDVILEVRGPVPEGSISHGYYNLRGRPLGGHLKASSCELIAFVSRQLFGSDTHSVQFYNSEGGCMFKIYLGRDAECRITPLQIERFKTLRDGLRRRL